MGRFAKSEPMPGNAVYLKIFRTQNLWLISPGSSECVVNSSHFCLKTQLLPVLAAGTQASATGASVRRGWGYPMPGVAGSRQFQSVPAGSRRFCLVPAGSSQFRPALACSGSRSGLCRLTRVWAVFVLSGK